MSDANQARFYHALKRAKTRKWLGKIGEAIACLYLELRGWTILERNLRCGRTPEIDIIALAPCGTTVFLEVKTRTISDNDRHWHESACQMMNFEKQRKMLRVAQMYTRQTLECRFDLILIGMTYSTAKKFCDEDDEMCDAIYENDRGWFDTRERTELPRSIDDLINRLVTTLPSENEQGQGLQIIHCPESVITRL